MNISSKTWIVSVTLALVSSLASVAWAQNTADPQQFIDGSARGCQGCDLREANLSGISRVNSRLRQAQLQSADLSDSNFEGSYFTCANLTNANLRNTKLRFANFVDANLSGVDLRGADLRNVDLGGAIVDETTNLDGANLDGAKLWDSATLYRPGVDLQRVPRSTQGEIDRVRCNNR